MYRSAQFLFFSAALACLCFLPASTQVRGQDDLPFPKGTIIKTGETEVKSTIKDYKDENGQADKGRVRFVMKRKAGMWGKRLFIYGPEGDEDHNIVKLELGHDQQGRDQLEVNIEKRSGDLRGKLVFALWHVGKLLTLPDCRLAVSEAH